METTGSHKTQARFSSCLDRDPKGGSITITTRGVPIARLVPVKHPSVLSAQEAIDGPNSFGSRGRPPGRMTVLRPLRQRCRSPWDYFFQPLNHLPRSIETAAFLRGRLMRGGMHYVHFVPIRNCLDPSLEPASNPIGPPSDPATIRPNPSPAQPPPKASSVEFLDRSVQGTLATDIQM
jgi:prevent-host-death family protein